MPDIIPIHQGQDFYVPYFEVKLRNRLLSEAVIRDVISVSYKDSISEIDNFEITINNWDAEKRRFKYSDETLFDPGEQVELWMGYYGRHRLRKMLSGEITSLRPTFPAEGRPTLVISGLNVLHRLRTKQESHAYQDLKDSEIATQIATRLGVAIETDAQARARETQYKYLFQDNQYDIVFLMERARRIGYDLFVAEDGENRVMFTPTVNIKRTVYRLTYGQNLIQFQPDLSTAKQVASVTVRGWDNTNKQEIKETVERDKIATRGVGIEGGQEKIAGSFDKREEIIADKPVQDEQEARTLARETLEDIAKDMLKGSGSAIGLPDLRAGTVLHIDGLGRRFSGRYFVTATRHQIADSGYTTQFDCRREEV